MPISYIRREEPVCHHPRTLSLSRPGWWLCACGAWHPLPHPPCTCAHPIRRPDLGRPGRVECGVCGLTIPKSKLVGKETA